MNLIQRALASWRDPPHPPPVVETHPPDQPRLMPVVQKGRVLRRQAFHRERPSTSFYTCLPLYQQYGDLVLFRVQLNDTEKMIEFEQANNFDARLIEEDDPVLVTSNSTGFLPFTYAKLDGAELLQEDLPLTLRETPASGDYVRRGIVVRMRAPGQGCPHYALAVRLDDDFGLDCLTYEQAADSRAALIREADSVIVRYLDLPWGRSVGITSD